MVKFQVSLDPTEAEALARWAESEMRDPRDQIRFLLRAELERRGLLAIIPAAQKTLMPDILGVSEMNSDLTPTNNLANAYCGQNHAEEFGESASAG